MTPAPLATSVLAIQNYAVSGVDKALADLSRAVRSGNVARIGNACDDLEKAASKLSTMAAEVLGQAETIRCADYDKSLAAYTVAPAEPFSTVTQGAG